VKPPTVDFDGEDMSAALLGNPKQRKKDLYWEYGRDRTYIYPGDPRDRSPNLALRSGNWKLLMNDDGAGTELYDLSRSRDESQNLAVRESKRAERMASRLLQWRRSLPKL
jgi:arylsulfatase A-like enzyme